MRWIPLIDATRLSGDASRGEGKAPSNTDRVQPDRRESLAAEYRAGRGIGPVTLGETCLFIKKLLSVYHIPYAQITRYFRRVALVNAKIGCCNGELQVEHLVICGDPEGNGERELAQIQLPGKKAALALMEELGRRAPEAASVCPPKPGGAAEIRDEDPARTQDAAGSFTGNPAKSSAENPAGSTTQDAAQSSAREGIPS